MKVTERRTAEDFAICMRDLAEGWEPGLINLIIEDGVGEREAAGKYTASGSEIVS